ncbi:YchJ family protein [Nocardioides fonticola]|uniref:UPF0225 protein GCM10022215_13410 n=1 Tax=Nocardioides fonticola TaxID=450363 RepID=A0ABP7XI30_9ACTN
MEPNDQCPCGTGTPYVACCAPLHRGTARAATAEQLMRSRYAAFARGEAGYLFRTWHPRTRPDEVELDPRVSWVRLEITDTLAGGAEEETGEVAFAAHWRTADGGSGVLVERSRFARRAGHWLYLDGEVT